MAILSRPCVSSTTSSSATSSRTSSPAQSVEDDLEQVPGSGIPFVRLETGQVADEEDDVPGVDVGADGPFGLASIEEYRDRFADRTQAVGGQGLRHARLDGGEDSALDARVAGHPVEPASQRGERLVLGEKGWRRRHELVDVFPVDLGEQVL